MKTVSFKKGIFLLPFFFSASLLAQTITSFDLGAIRQKNHHSGGINISGFYHFTEQLLGGMEVNRFFPVNRVVGEEMETEQLSGWDVEMNIHFLVPIQKGLKFYPVTGISHTSEKEVNPITHKNFYKRFWSLNTGAGLQLEWHKWLPHLEYLFSWGELNQQFILMGIGYEIEWGNHKKAHSGK